MSMVISGDNGLTFPAGSTQVQAGNYQTMVNRIINGRMEIDQRNAGVSLTLNGSSGQYGVDRIAYNTSQASKLTAQQSTTVPVGFYNSNLVTVSSAATIGSGDYFTMYQYIEANNVSDLNFGSANAKTVTLSFWVRSSVTGTFVVGLLNGALNRSYLATYTISAANTWEQKFVTIAGDTTGTWTTGGNGIGLTVRFDLGSGSSGMGTANAWQAGNLWSVSGSASSTFAAQSGATFYITGVDLRVGSYTVVPQDFRAYGTELMLCQRYYQVIASGNAKAIGMATYYTSSNFSGVINWGVPMRTDPTFSQVTGTNYYRGQGNAATDDFNSFNVDRASPQMMMWYNTSEVSGTQGTASVVYTVNNASFLAVQAEL